jgi:hypothetical protein
MYRYEIPESLRNDRVFRIDRSQPWREDWDRFDFLLEAIYKALVISGTIPETDVLAFRSNKAEVAIFEDRGRWSVLWDERFFDYLALQLDLLAEDDPDVIRGQVFRTLSRYAGEVHVVEDPYFAIIMQKHARYFIDGKGPVDRDVEMLMFLESLFRVMRTFVLCHELGHIAVKNHEIRDLQKKNLETVFASLQFIVDKKLFSPSLGEFGGNDETHIRRIAAAAEDKNTENEMIIDAFALGQTFQAERALLDKSGLGDSEPDVVRMFVTIYQAMILLYYIMASMNGFREMLRPKSVRNNFTLDKFRSASTLSSRADIRGQLCSIMIASEVQHDIRIIERVSDACSQAEVDMRRRFRSTQLNAYAEFLRDLDRDRLVREADRLRSELNNKKAAARAARQYGF